MARTNHSLALAAATIALGAAACTTQPQAVQSAALHSRVSINLHQYQHQDEDQEYQ